MTSERVKSAVEAKHFPGRDVSVASVQRAVGGNQLVRDPCRENRPIRPADTEDAVPLER